jgi:prolyl-tRNA synthetase
MAAIVEQYHDENGIIWPDAVAPFDVHLVALTKKLDDEVGQQAEALYRQLQEAGLEVLFDDRKESPGVKFADADLIGLPWRVTVSSRSMQSGGVEVKRRREAEREIVPVADLLGYLQHGAGA